MNHIYRLIWNARLRGWAVASELTRARGKRSRVASRASLACVLTLAAATAHAQTLPTGGEVTAGHGSIQQSGNQLTVTQGSRNLVVHWQQFDIGEHDAVRFVQPDASSIALNRVLGHDPSQILGRLDANGQVWVINPNGVLFGQSAQVDVGGLVASTLNLSDADFLNGRRTFEGAGAGGTANRIVNHGNLTARDGGYVALLGGRVSNHGIVSARLGTVALAAGERVTLDFAGDALLNVSVEKGALDALVENHQLIRADGGQVLMTAHASNAVLDTVVNNTGIVEARTVQREGGVIKLLGGFEGGTVNVAGTLDASAPEGGDGGFIDTSGHKVRIADEARITTLAAHGRTGNWLIDPNDYTIAASGGDITGTALSTQLASNNVTIRSIDGADTGGNGDIFVNDPVAWGSSTTLTLQAVRHIEINDTITNTGTGNLVLRADVNGTGTGTVHFGASGSVSMTGGRTDIYYNPPVTPVVFSEPTDFSGNVSGSFTAWMLVNSIEQVHTIRNNLSADYALGRDIDASSTSIWNAGTGFTPIGSTLTPFTGRLDGLNHTISGLYIDRPSIDGVGLFADMRGTVRNVGLVNTTIVGRDTVGAFAGVIGSGGSLSGSYVTGSVSGRSQVGGLVGGLYTGSITDSHVTAPVSGTESVGGLAGFISGGTFFRSYATGAVTGTGDFVGGLAGNVSSTSSFTQVHATGAVSGKRYTGGLIGYLFNSSSITQSYATGATSGTQFVGGLVGGLFSSTVTQSYAANTVTGSTAGGIAGSVGSGIVNTDLFWDTELSGRSTATGSGTLAGATGLSTSEMMQASSFTGWDISNVGGSSAVWRIYEGRSLPLLRSYLAPLTITIGDASKTYDGLAFSGGDLTYSGFRAGEGPEDLLGTVSFGNLRNAGTYTLDDAGLYSGQYGYDISYVAGTLTIDKRALTIGATGHDRTYNGTTSATVTLTDDRVSGDKLSLSYSSATFADRHVGEDKAVSVTGISVTGDDAGNYTWNTSTSTTATINPATLNVVGAVAQSRVYDGTTDAEIQGASLDGVIGSDDVSLTNATTGTFADKHAGNGKTVSTAMGLSGTDATNYVLVQPTLTAHISRATLSVVDAVAQSRVYDGTTHATIQGAMLTGVIGSDDVTLTNASTGSFADKHVGTGKAVTTAMGLTGADADNYTLVQPGLSADIEARALLISATGQNRVYDGTTDATVALSDDRLEGDVLTVRYGSAQFEDAEVGTDKRIDVLDITVDGADAGNYTWSASVQARADILPDPSAGPGSDPGSGDEVGSGPEGDVGPGSGGDVGSGGDAGSGSGGDEGSGSGGDAGPGSGGDAGPGSGGDAGPGSGSDSGPSVPPATGSPTRLALDQIAPEAARPDVAHELRFRETAGPELRRIDGGMRLPVGLDEEETGQPDRN